MILNLSLLCRYFTEFDPELYNPGYLQPKWPVADKNGNDGVKLRDSFLPDQAIEYEEGKGVTIESQCGDTMCTFRIKCYHYASVQQSADGTG